VIKHPKLTANKAIKMLHFLGKMILYDPVYSRLASVPFLLLMQRWPNDSQIVNFTVDFIKKELSILIAIEAQLNDSEVQSPSSSKIKLPSITSKGDKGKVRKLTVSATSATLEALQVKKVLVLESLAKILLLKIDNITDRSKHFINKALDQLESKMTAKHIGLRNVMHWLGSEGEDVKRISNNVARKASKDHIKSEVEDLGVSSSSPDLVVRQADRAQVQTAKSADSPKKKVVNTKVQKDIDMIKKRREDMVQMKIERELQDRMAKEKLKEKLKKDLDKAKGGEEQNLEDGNPFVKFAKEVKDTESALRMFHDWKLQLKKLFKVYTLLHMSDFEVRSSLSMTSFMRFNKDFNYIVTRDEAMQMYSYHLKLAKNTEIEFPYFLSCLRAMVLYLHRESARGEESEALWGSDFINKLIDVCNGNPTHTAGIRYEQCQHMLSYITLYLL
jgi:hypothetical protein